MLFPWDSMDPKSVPRVGCFSLSVVRCAPRFLSLTLERDRIMHLFLARCNRKRYDQREPLLVCWLTSIYLSAGSSAVDWFCLVITPFQQISESIRPDPVPPTTPINLLA